MVVTFSDTLGTSAAAAVRGTVTAGWGVSPTVGTLSASPVSHGPLATISDAGNAVVGWSTSSAVQFAHFGPTGAFPAPATVQSIATDTPDDFALAGNGRGDAIAAWYTFDTRVMRTSCKRRREAEHERSFGNPQIVSSTTVFSSLPVIGLDELGDGVVPYQLGATPNGVAAAIFDGAPPQLGTVSKPGSVQAGKAAAFSAKATDAFSAVTLRWSFGDGSAAATGTSVTHKYARSGRFTVTLTATDAAGNSGSTTFTVTVASAPPPPAAEVRRAEADGQDPVAGAHRAVPGALQARQGPPAEEAEAPQVAQADREELLARARCGSRQRHEGRRDARRGAEAEAEEAQEVAVCPFRDA